MTPLQFADAIIEADRQANLPGQSAMLGDRHRLIIAACYAFDVSNGAAHADESTAEMLYSDDTSTDDGSNLIEFYPALRAFMDLVYEA